MCRSNVDPSAREALTSLLVDMAAALSPDDPEGVKVGPVDFGPPEWDDQWQRMYERATAEGDSAPPRDKDRESAKSPHSGRSVS